MFRFTRAEFPPVFIFVLSLVLIGVTASAVGVKGADSIITVGLGAVGFVLHGRRDDKKEEPQGSNEPEG